MNDNKYDWIEFYSKFADTLCTYVGNRSVLIDIVKSVYENTGIKMPKLETNNELTDIDPFTVFAIFNKGIKADNRKLLINEFKTLMHIDAPEPEGFNGIPVLNNRNSTFYKFKDDGRGENDIAGLWDVFVDALEYADNPSEASRSVFINAFNTIKDLKGNNWKLTIGLYWIRPNRFVNLDSNNRRLLKTSGIVSDNVSGMVEKLDRIPDASTYLSICDSLIDDISTGICKYKSLPELSNAAWAFSDSNKDDKFWPSLDEYDPGLTKDDWLHILNDSTLIGPIWGGCLAMFYTEKDGTSCSFLEKKFDYNAGSLRASCIQLAMAIYKKTDCKLPPSDDEKTRYWPILFRGRNATKDEVGSYIWKLRDELFNAISESDILQYLPKDKEGEKMSNMFSKNMILYGPPGTGKTYNTVNYAVAICDNRDIKDVQKQDYKLVLQRYRELLDSDRIAFTTFHQSYGYEEFIEGIKPIIDDDREDIRYTIEDGSFKKFCKKAKGAELNIAVASGEFKGAINQRVWSIMLDGTGSSALKSDCFNNGYIRIGWNDQPEIIDNNTAGISQDNIDTLLRFQDEMEIGDLVITAKSLKQIDGIGIVTGDYEYDDSNKLFPRKRTVQWLAKGIDYNVLSINAGKQLTRDTVWPQKRITSDILLKEMKLDSVGIVENTDKQNYVFIIDEINRGNISKIFGELITLIEPTKRLGSVEEMAALLPYSGEKFSVPDNVYIIGTMNTADRSIALIDTALRRRFDFVEMMPDTNVLRTLKADNIDDNGQSLNVADMLDKINERIAYLFDREHTIGHAYFIRLKDDPTIEALSDIFIKNIMPLLQEYFFDDYSKIQLVLGDNGKADDQYKFIKDTRIGKDIFDSNLDIDLDEPKYEINIEAFSKIQSYQQI